MPAAIVARELNIRTVETVAVKSYDHQNQGGIKVLKEISRPVLDLVAQGGKVLIVDDLVDTGNTARVVREMLPGAHFATVYAKPKGRELVDTFITEVSQDTWIFFPWDLDVAYVAPISAARTKGADPVSALADRLRPWRRPPRVIGRQGYERAGTLASHPILWH